MAAAVRCISFGLERQLGLEFRFKRGPGVGTGTHKKQKVDKLSRVPRGQLQLYCDLADAKLLTDATEPRLAREVDKCCVVGYISWGKALDIWTQHQQPHSQWRIFGKEIDVLSSSSKRVYIHCISVTPTRRDHKAAGHPPPRARSPPSEAAAAIPTSAGLRRHELEEGIKSRRA
ncbi:hypothetical protein U9M48_025057 [Paspalum notatum var. saurae]|uniref:Uncharacterized protein n=1 Tax=Paspalum notatum var. saurae TaxID=547442 RepID=A0AAQ3TN22_PASNO